MHKDPVMRMYSRFTALVVAFTAFALARAIAGLTAEPPRPETLGLPSVAAPTADPGAFEKIDLGRALFHDARLSADGKISCASCHRAELAHTDGRAVAEGVDGLKGTRNAPNGSYRLLAKFTVVGQRA